MTRGRGRTAWALLLGLLVATSGAGPALGGVLVQGPTGDGAALATLAGASALTTGFGVTRAVVAPLGSLGIFQSDTSRPVETAWDSVGPTPMAGQGPAARPWLTSLSLPALATARGKALASGAGGGLPDATTGRPSDDFSYLGLGPKTFTVLRSGRPSGGLEQWSHATETSLSYVQPRRHLEFVVKFFGESNAERTDSLSDSPLRSQVQLIDDLHVDVDSSNMRARSSTYGQIETTGASKEPPAGRMLAVGLDLGLLPAVVGNLGLNSALLIGRSSNPGLYVGLAMNVEFPSDRGTQGAPDVAYRPPYDVGSGGAEGPGLNFGGGGLGTGNVSGATGAATNNGANGGEIPISLTPTGPEVPEPGTLLLVAAGGAWLAARRRAGK